MYGVYNDSVVCVQCIANIICSLGSDHVLLHPNSMEQCKILSVCDFAFVTWQKRVPDGKTSVFLLLNLPSHIFRVTVFLMQLLNEPPLVSTSTFYIIHEICQLLYYINFAANFFLYIASSTGFRSAFKSLWLRYPRACGQCRCQ